MARNINSSAFDPPTPSKQRPRKCLFVYLFAIAPPTFEPRYLAGQLPTSLHFKFMADGAGFRVGDRPLERPLDKRDSNFDSLTTDSAKTDDSVYRRLTSVIGVHPNRSELTAIVTALGWIQLGRSEKRVKALLIQKLEGARDKILPTLETLQGTRALKRAYLNLIEGRRADTKELPPPPRKLEPSGLPPEATVGFYLNEHNAEPEWR